ncbi:MAG: hypothetical protein QM755_19825 [Luteolibacter sp.]
MTIAERPAWLTDAFTDTGWDIGIDEGFTDVENVETAVGAGRSIEWTFSVWSCDVPTPSTVLLGSLQQEETASPPREVLRTMASSQRPLSATRPTSQAQVSSSQPPDRTHGASSLPTLASAIVDERHKRLH